VARGPGTGGAIVAELRFDGRVAIVTGSGRGVGRGHAMVLASRGAKVVVADLGGRVAGGDGGSPEPAEHVVEEIRAAGGAAVACHASIAEEEGAASIVQAAIDAFGRLDIVVNNAGIADPGWFEDLTLEQFRRMNAVHYLGVVYVTRLAYPHMVAAGYGRIVTTFSEAVVGTVPKNTSYGGGKGGAFGFMKCLALDSVRHGILVNAVSPRAGTRLNSPEEMAVVFDRPAEWFTSLPEQFPPEGVAPAMAYLAHESCRLNGEVLVCGGGTAKRLAIVESRGLTSDDLTPELIADNLDQLMDLGDAEVVDVRAALRDRGD
jgi:NAD(P)-dependent dehydrogenase (short-subunit alcohol dehydrogenase family)